MKAKRVVQFVAILVACLTCAVGPELQADDSNATATGTLSIQFYNNPEDAQPTEQVSVEYAPARQDPVLIANHFFSYTSRVLFNIGQDSPVFTAFLGLVSKTIRGSISKKTNVLTSAHFRMKLVKPRNVYTKYCYAKFFPDNNDQTLFSFGGEEYYASVSVFAFLQHIINTSSERDLQAFSTELKRLQAKASTPQVRPDTNEVSPKDLVFHWHQTIDKCVKPDQKAGTDEESKRGAVALSRVFVAKYIYVDFALRSKLENQPACRERYIGEVNSILFTKPNDFEVQRLHGKNYKKWFTETAEDIISQMGKYSKQETDMPVAYYLARAALSFGAIQSSDKNELQRVTKCIFADSELLEGIAACASRRCKQ